MKNITTFLFLIILCVTTNAQNIFLIKSDTLKGADTLSFTTNELTRTNKLVAIQIECNDITGTSSLDSIVGITSITGNLYAPITEQTCGIWTFPAPKIAINGEVTLIVDIVGIPNNYFGFFTYGVAGDTAVCNSYGVTKR